MTREQALETLKEMAFTAYGHRSEALDMAISALSAEPCDDCISRQAVLDGIEELKKSPWATDTRGTGFEYLIAESLDTVRDLVVKPIPSVENKGEDRPKGHWIYPNNGYPITSPLYNHPYMWKSICSNCNTGFPTINKDYKFCPDCGADMRGKANEDNH